MKRISLIIAVIVGSVAAFAQPGPRKAPNPALRAEMAAYYEKEIHPVLEEQHALLINSLGESDQLKVAELREKSKEAREASKEMMQNIKTEKENGASREDIRELYGEQMMEARQNRRLLANELETLAFDNREALTATTESLKPYKETWQEAMKAIRQSHISDEDVEKMKENRRNRFQGNEKGREGFRGKGGQMGFGGHRGKMGMRGAGSHGFRGEKGMARFLLWDGEMKPGGEDMGSRIGIELPSLEQNYPNPVLNQTTITFDLPEQMDKVRLNISDLDGNVLQRLEVSDVQKGANSVSLDLQGFTSGVYLYTLEGEGFKTTKKLYVR